jgi:hypothetical protein
VPLTLYIVDLIATGKFRYFVKRGSQNRLVAIAVMRWPEGSAYRVIDKDSSRRCHFAHYVQSGADHQGWNAARLNNMGDETDGLMAKRSIGHQQGEIYRHLL